MSILLLQKNLHLETDNSLALGPLALTNQPVLPCILVVHCLTMKKLHKSNFKKLVRHPRFFNFKKNIYDTFMSLIKPVELGEPNLDTIGEQWVEGPDVIFHC